MERVGRRNSEHVRLTGSKDVRYIPTIRVDLTTDHP